MLFFLLTVNCLLLTYLILGVVYVVDSYKRPKDDRDVLPNGNEHKSS